MDIKLINNKGELYINEQQIEFFNIDEKQFEVIQQIVLMLHIRAGELKFDINYGLDYNVIYGTHGEEEEVLEHVKNQILLNFNDYLDKCYISSYTFENRQLEMDITIQFRNEKNAIVLKGVGIGWQQLV
jgi:hypothetical protein